MGLQRFAILRSQELREQARLLIFDRISGYGPVLKAFLRAQYHEQLEAQGGTAPYTWKLAQGSLPPGIHLDPSGVLEGFPTETGDFHFSVTLSDNGRPAHQRNQELVLRVLAGLLVQWGNLAKINGQRIEGSVKVSNQTGDDFDLTALFWR